MSLNAILPKGGTKLHIVVLVKQVPDWDIPPSSFKVDEAQLQQGLSNLTSLAMTTPLTILEHHALRDEAWQQRTRPVYEAASKAGNAVKTAAEFAGEENVFLESQRKQLYEENPPSKEFEKWMRESSDKPNISKPPL